MGRGDGCVGGGKGAGILLCKEVVQGNPLEHKAASTCNEGLLWLNCTRTDHGAVHLKLMITKSKSSGDFTFCC